jgi:hypothetical protein
MNAVLAAGAQVNEWTQLLPRPVLLLEYGGLCP